jgi:protein-S-isoprenylcysteine O-methyltransferase Ste14
MKSIHPDFLELSSIAWLILMLYWLFASMKTKMTIRKETSSSRIIHVLMLMLAFALIYNDRLAIGFLRFGLIPKTNGVSWLGLFINVTGIAFAILARSWLGTNWSAIVTIKRDHQLIQNGPYAITRHPIYTGLLFGIVGSAIILGEWRGFIGVILFVIAIRRKMAVEENFMESTFEEYKKYKRRTKRLIPFIY